MKARLRDSDVFGPDTWRGGHSRSSRRSKLQRLGHQRGGASGIDLATLLTHLVDGPTSPLLALLRYV